MPIYDDGDQDTMNETYREMVNNLEDSADEFEPDFSFSYSDSFNNQQQLIPFQEE